MGVVMFVVIKKIMKIVIIMRGQFVQSKKTVSPGETSDARL